MKGINNTGTYYKSKHSKHLYFSQQCEKFKHDTLKLWQLINQISGKQNDKSTTIDYITVEGIKKYRSTNISNEFPHYYANLRQKLAENMNPCTKSIDYYLAKIK